jgi:hypothetical protein
MLLQASRQSRCRPSWYCILRPLGWLRRVARELEDNARKRDTARRVRECAQRAKAGRRKVWVEIGPDDEDTLMAAGALGEWDFDDRKAISKAIERLLALVREKGSA